MNKQLVLVLGGVVVIALLFFFGSTTKPKSATTTANTVVAVSYNIDSILVAQQAQLTDSQQTYINNQLQSVKRGAVASDQIKTYNTLAKYYLEELKQKDAYLFYLHKAAKLENSEKNLTFAAQLYLASVKVEHEPAKLAWLTNNSIDLFQSALVLNPTNADLKIGLGSSYVYGKGQSADPQELMTGVAKLLEVVREDSTNMKAQLVLGVGGFVSTQYDKAVTRLLKVVEAEPSNVEAVAFLADSYAAMGNKTEAVKWYEKSKLLINNPEYTKEVDERIKQLK